jgi:rRNA-processing protein FCF1
LNLGLKNGEKLFIATQDQGLREHFQTIPGVPCIFFKKNLLKIDKLSKATLNLLSQVYKSDSFSYL